MTPVRELDLVLLVPGKDERETLDAILSRRHLSLGIRRVRYEIFRHPRKDGGVFSEAVEVLRSLQRRAHHALAVFDHEGSGQEDRPANEVEADLRTRLRASGWQDRADVLVIQPELEIWVWSDSPQVDAALGWAGRLPALRSWLRERGCWEQGLAKPLRPRECLLAALREARTQYSSAIFRRLAESVGLERCHDESFRRLKQLLQSWFPERE